MLVPLVLLLSLGPLAMARQPPPAAQAQQQRPQVQRPAPGEVDPNSMVMAALQAAQLVDANRAGDVWEGGSSVAKKAMGKDAFIRQVAASRAALGQPQSRVWLSVIRQQVDAAGGRQAPPPGMYVSVRFATRFSGGKTVAELVSFHLDENATWRVAGYAIQ
ncbi:DUF4019 domain-containing protein [Lysobacter pythonis]|uniref:DUF4019 domain-containing protein n=1 Tax=Solilutibacter pythonis TaxID=2483112 RepID=A0A3M2HZ90_9GAMM|nr:DUF4019 domain-containing protein [Lysobacter pythonis]